MQVDPKEAARTWLPRSSFETSVGFLAHALHYFLERWTLGREMDLQRLAQAQVSFSSAKSLDEAKVAVKELCEKIGGQKLQLPLLLKLEEMVNCIGEREYTSANKIYMDLVIGSKKWLNDMPYMVNFSMSRQDTEVHWTSQSASDPVDDAGIRQHIVALRRLMMVLQVLDPNADPSKNCSWPFAMAEQVEEAAPFGNVKLKVMAYTIPMMGHALPLVSLCKALAQRGHQVTLAASSGLPQLQESCTTAGLKHAPLDDGFTPELLKAQDPMGPVFWDFMNADQKLFSSLLENESPDVVVSDYVSAAPFEICRTKKIPLVLNIPLPGTLVRRMQILTYPFVGKILRPAMPATMKNALIFLTQNVLPVAGRTLSIINSCAATWNLKG
eukprot:symbB.v1.2.001626.t1/scaffold80.1/size342472/13